MHTTIYMNILLVIMQIDKKGSEKILGDTFRRYIETLRSCLIWFGNIVVIVMFLALLNRLSKVCLYICCVFDTIPSKV